MRFVVVDELNHRNTNEMKTAWLKYTQGFDSQFRKPQNQNLNHNRQNPGWCSSLNLICSWNLFRFHVNQVRFKLCDFQSIKLQNPQNWSSFLSSSHQNQNTWRRFSFTRFCTLEYFYNFNQQQANYNENEAISAWVQTA